jgi:transposase-like protein
MAGEKNLLHLMAEYGGEGDEDRARSYLEGLRWPDGPVCPHCGTQGAYRLTAKPESKHPVRKGVLKCRACRKQFTVRVGTTFEDSHIALSTWVIAIHLLCASKKGMSAHQLHRMLGITYKSAWFMAHRIRHAMARPPLSGKLAGIVEADETYVGGKPRRKRGERRVGYTDKAPVFALVERGGRVRSFHVSRVTGKNLREAVLTHVEPGTRIMTDENPVYRAVFSERESVRHTAGVYVRGDVHVNTVESYFALLKRGVIGTYHHVSKKHLHRYLAEFDFRWNERHVDDGIRAMLATQLFEGKRLTFKPLRASEG